MKDDRAGGNIFDSAKVQAFANFEKDLLNDLIPYIQKNYPVIQTGNTVPSQAFPWAAGSHSILVWETSISLPGSEHFQLHRIQRFLSNW
jgi:hypothetical protein